MRFVVLLVIGCSSSPPPGGDDDVEPDAPVAPVEGTAGCGMPTDLATEELVAQPIGGTREYYLRLPAGYDPMRPYPIVYQQHGCSSSAARQNNIVPLEGQIGADAILVRTRAAADCWDTSATGADLAYWDAMREDVEARFCVDPARRFATGYSSGSFMTHRLACIRGALFRGVATIAGGQRERDCTGDPAALLIHDLDDSVVGIGASEQARDAYLERHGCTGAATTPTDQPPCVRYDGCAKPVVWCQTTGRDHDRQDALAAPIFWAFFSGL